MSVFNRAAPKYLPIPQELEGLMESLYGARDDEDEKRKVEALIRPLLTSESVNTVYGNGAPTLGTLATGSSSLLAVALRLEPDPDIISMSLHRAVRPPQTPISSVKALVDAGADVNFNPRLAFTDEDMPEAFSGYRDDSPLSCMFSCAAFEKDDPAVLEKMGILLQAGAIADYKGSSEDSETPLYGSIFNQDLKSVKLLLAHNADPNQLAFHGNPLVAVAAMANYTNGKTGAELKWIPRDATSDLILVALLRRGVDEKHLRFVVDLPQHPDNPPPAQRAFLQKVLDGKPAWCEICSAIRNLKVCKCVSVAYCGKECQRLDWKKHKLVCASSINAAILTEEKAAFAREGQKKKKAKAKANKKVSEKKK